jgi:hypothetical protein
MFQKVNSEIILIISMLAILSCLFAIPSSSAQSELPQKALQYFQNFTSLGDQERMNAAARMSADEKAMIMMGAAQMTQEVNETIAGMSPAELQKATIHNSGNAGSQNYFLGNIANNYDTVVIASKPFGTVFATSNLKS